MIYGSKGNQHALIEQKGTGNILKYLSDLNAVGMQE